MVTFTEENYIKVIYHLGGQGENNVSTNAIANNIETTASSVTDIVKKS
jgi:DtxR family Mn-dependent transcriptional regulator